MSQKTLHDRYEMIKNYLDEKGHRLWCANEAISIGYGGTACVAKITGVSRTTIIEGIKELKKEKIMAESGKIRRSGGGRKKAKEKDKTLISDLERLVEPVTRGDPESPLRWTSKSTQKLANELNKNQYRASERLVARLLRDMEYSLQSNKKRKEGEDHPDRNAQFEFINAKAKDFQARNQPVVSVDTKKKELIGNYKNNGQEYCQKGKPREVNMHDFPNKELGKVAPYGIYDIDKNKGWVSVGISSDTAEFSVNSIRSWWNKMGKEVYPNAIEIYINADGGGSNGYRTKLWKIELQKFATEMSLIIHISHFPPGTSKWNKIEHRLFSYISKNWRGHPLIDRATVVSLIGNTTTKKGLVVRAELDENVYQKGIKVSDEELAQVNLQKDMFHGEWNYTIFPKL